MPTPNQLAAITALIPTELHSHCQPVLRPLVDSDLQMIDGNFTLNAQGWQHFFNLHADFYPEDAAMYRALAAEAYAAHGTRFN